MKKTFILSSEKIATPRLVDAIKHEIRKYLKRERRKALPKGMNYWDFDCRFGADQESSEVIAVSDINASITQAEKSEMEKFYLEIIARPAYREKGLAAKQTVANEQSEDDELS